MASALTKDITPGDICACQSLSSPFLPPTPQMILAPPTPFLFELLRILENRAYQQTLAAEQARLPKASATPFPRILPRAERSVTALEKRRMMNATVDRIV